MTELKLVRHEHKSGYLYVLQRSEDFAVKVGYSINPLDRAKVMSSHPRNGDVQLLFQIEAGCMICEERWTHEYLSKFRLPADAKAGSTEWFATSARAAIEAVLVGVGFYEEFRCKELRGIVA